MNKFTSIADEFLESFDGKNINDKLFEFVKKRGFTQVEHQRLVEEINISSFLRKLSSKDHYNDYELVDPIMELTTEPKEMETSSLIKKEASEKGSFVITPDMFDISRNTLEFTPSFSLDSSSSDNEMNEKAMLRKEAHAKKETISVIADIEKGRDALAMSDAIQLATQNLIKMANESPASAKHILYELSKADLFKIANNVVEDCKFNTAEIAKSKMSSLTKESNASSNSAIEATKALARIPVNAAKATYYTGKTVINNPIKSAVAGAGIYQAVKSGPDSVDKLRDSMMLKTRGGFNG